MAQIFGPSSNPLSKLSIALGAMGLGALIAGAAAFYRSDYMTGVDVAMEQPVPFSHRHHVAGIGLDCRYCHLTVETAAFAGIPSTDVCMTCHVQIWADSPTLEPVRESYRTDRSIRWNKVHDLPDYVYFDHSIHINKGVGCVTCHGHVDQMPLVYRKASLRMEWCLECHRAPEKYLRPREQVFNMDWEPRQDQLSLGERLAREYKVQKLTVCYTCHR
jgi:hypothetical protein